MNTKPHYVSQMAPVAPVVDVSNGAPTLLEQMERHFSATRMSGLAKAAYLGLHSISEMPAEEQEHQVAQLSSLSVANSGMSSPGSDSRQVRAVMSSALLMVSRGVRLTASERVDKACELLSQHYQADW